MSDPSYDEMDEEELAAFLGSGGTGVVSLATGADEPPHSVPVSYGFDAAGQHFYFRFAVDADSEKRGLLEGGPATLVVFEQTEDTWRSVVATGELHEVTEEDIASGILEGLRRTHIPMYEVFDRPTSETSFRFFWLDYEDLTGRKGEL